MTTGFDQLQHELADAERRLTAPAATPAQRSHRRRIQPDLLVGALAGLVALAVAGGALVALHGSTAPTGVSSHQRSTANSTVPASSAAQILGVLRRPQNSADLTSPLLSGNRGAGLGLIRSGARLATTTSGGQRVFVIPARPGPRSGQSTHAVVALAVGRVSDPFTIQDIQSGRAAFEVNQSPQLPYYTFVLVPDGVARVTLLGTQQAGPAQMTAQVHANVAIFQTAVTIPSSPRTARWYSTDGTGIPIQDRPNPPPRYPVNAHGETYGAESAAAGTPAQQPDLIAAYGRGPHGTHVSGYIKRAQFDAASCGDVKTPKQAVACTKAHRGKPTTIPVYARNGTTIIGTFIIK